MTIQTGAQASVLIGVESAFKTIATAGFVMQINSSSVKSTRSQETPKTIRGDLNPPEPFSGNIDVAGKIVVPVDSIAFWYWLQLALGDPTTTGSGPYVHTFKAGTTRSSFTLEYQFTELGTSKYFQYTGCKVAGMSFSAGVEGELLATFDVVGAVETIATSSFDGSPTTPDFSRLKNRHLAMTEGGSAINNAKSVDCNINFNLDTSQYVIGGSSVRGSLPDSIFTVGGNLSAMFEDTALLEKAIDSTESAIVMTFTNGATSILAITIPEVKYERSSPGIDGPQGIAISLPFSAFYNDATQATSFQAVITNSVAHA
ncbi:MAG: hypothetical protein HOE02_05645 [Candidatus Marinimicrobia bacterium]|jgi:hypothetical protein|nr:hypothetical protein [Candidatus Neomarinimicrobiota bacterium]